MRKVSAEALKRLRLERGLSMTRIAELSGISPSMYHKLENGVRRLNIPMAQKLADALEVPLARVVDPQSEIPIGGKILDALIIWTGDYPMMDIETKNAPRPPGLVPSVYTTALLVGDDSLTPLSDEGWVVYFENEPQPVGAEHIGKLCVIWRFGETRASQIRRVFRGNVLGRFDLQMPSGGKIEDNVPLSGVAPIKWIYCDP